MKQQRLRHYTALLFTVLGAWIAPGSPAHAQERVRLALNLSPISALPLIAQEKGFFQKHGLEVAITNFSSGRQALETVLGGGADIATAAEAPVTAATFANQRISLLARMEYSDLKTLVTFPDFKTTLDLKGRRLGYAAGTGSEVYTHELLKKLGLKKSDVTLVALRPQDMVAAAAAGSIDAYNIWEPFVAGGQRALGSKARVLEVKDVYAETFNVVVTTEYAQRHPKTNEAFLRALLDAERWLKANQEDAISLVAKLTGMKREDLAEVWKNYVFELTLDQRTLNALRNHGQWRIDTGNAAGDAKVLPDFRKVIDAAPLRKIAPERVKL